MCYPYSSTVIDPMLRLPLSLNPVVELPSLQPLYKRFLPKVWLRIGSLLSVGIASDNFAG